MWRGNRCGPLPIGVSDAMTEIMRSWRRKMEPDLQHRPTKSFPRHPTLRFKMSGNGVCKCNPIGLRWK